MEISHYKAVFRRSTHSGYTKDFLQATQSVSEAIGAMFDGELPHRPAYRWPGGSFSGKIYFGTDRIEVGQWTTETPRPWQIGDPADRVITLAGDPEAAIPEQADAQWPALQESEPWLLLVQLDDSQAELQLRAYLGAPPANQLDAGLDRIPASLRQHMQGKGGLAGGDLPALWFDPDELWDCWHLEAESPSEVPPVSASAPDSPPLAAGRSLGSEYRPADENVSSTAPEPFEVDPDKRDRGTRAHAVTQNALSELIRRRGFTPRSPKPGEPNYDLAWEEEGVLVVAEVKSVTRRNSEKQLRSALGQVLRYRSLLERGGGEVRSMIALSGAPHDERWVALCEEHDVHLIWMPDLADGLAAFVG